MATTLRCPSMWLDVAFQNRKQMAKALWAPKVRCEKEREICACDSAYPFPFLLLCSYSVCIVCLFFCSYGQFWGGWTHPVSLPGRGCRYPSSTHSQLPSAAGHLVQRWAQDSTQQSHVSPFFKVVFVPVDSFLCFTPYCVWSSEHFLVLCLFQGAFECFSLRASVPSCRLSFILLHFVLKKSLNFSCRTRPKQFWRCVEWNGPFVPHFYLKRNLNQPLLFQLICDSVFLHFGLRVFLRWPISVCQPAAVVFMRHHHYLIGLASTEAADSLKWDSCFASPICSLKIEGCKWRVWLGKMSCLSVVIFATRKEYWSILVLKLHGFFLLCAPIWEIWKWFI